MPSRSFIRREEEEEEADGINFPRARESFKEYSATRRYCLK